MPMSGYEYSFERIGLDESCARAPCVARTASQLGVDMEFRIYERTKVINNMYEGFEVFPCVISFEGMY